MHNSDNPSFSERHGLAAVHPEIDIWNDAPDFLRFTVLNAAYEIPWIKPSALRDIVCKLLRKMPNPSNWSEYPNISGEVESLVYNCEWYRVYDIMEKVAHFIGAHGSREESLAFQRELNETMRALGIGWQLWDGLVVPRGTDAYESLFNDARATLEDPETKVAQNELSEAIRDLARRPNPDLSGAVQHAMAALESVARHVTGLPKPTLGQIVGGMSNPIPKPLDEAIGKIWGYASEEARHGRENRQMTREEAQLSA